MNPKSIHVMCVTCVTGNNSMTWMRAESWCVQNIPNSHLVSINSQQEMMFLERAIRKMKIFIHNNAFEEHTQFDNTAFYLSAGILNLFFNDSVTYIDKASTIYIGLHNDIQVMKSCNHKVIHTLSIV